MPEIWVSNSLVPIGHALVCGGGGGGGGGGGSEASFDEEAMIVGFFQSVIYVPHRFFYVPVCNTLCSRKLFANKGQNNLSKNLYFVQALYGFS